LIFTASADQAKQQTLKDLGAKIIEVPQANQPGKVDLQGVMRWLGQHDINELHVEAGANLNGAFWQSDCVDELLLYMAPMFLGDGLPMLKLPGIDQLSEAGQLAFIDHQTFEPDIRVRARTVSRWQALVDHIQANNQRMQ
jgi:diaminohydroxyphosphoribosylaminopyrimidine deaminase/5-amino-6-(5-phosphoribosylamino)uracil reductase